MEVAGDPVIEATLIESLSGRPLGADNIATLIESTVWPDIARSLNAGLRYGINDVFARGEQLQRVAPAIEELRFGPRLGASIEYRNGHLHFEGRLAISGVLAD